MLVNLVEWLKDWFYTEDEIDVQMGNKISKSQTSGLVKNDGTIDDTDYQELLVSGSNIKTINSQSILGDGDLEVGGGSGGGIYAFGVDFSDVDDAFLYIDASSGVSYHLAFDEASYTALGGSATVSVTLLENYEPLENATVTFTSDESTTTTATTDSNGVATATINFSGDTTLTATYETASDTCTITVLSYLFYDDCSVDNTSNYTSQSLCNGTGNATLVFNSNQTAYACNKSASGYALIQFGNLTLQNNMKISADIKIGSSWANNGILGFADKDNPRTSYAFGGFAQGETYYCLLETNGNTEIGRTTNSKWSSLSISDYNHHELVYQNGVVTYTITNPSNVSKTLTLTLQGSNYIGGKVGLWVECNTSPNCYIKNIVAEPI